jgi:hypothetical protein
MSKQLGVERNWNEEFQLLLSELRRPGVDIRHVYVKLSELGKDFLDAAKAYGKIIVAEYCLRSAAKTIKKSSLKGVAGGKKYICNNIVFKFAVDSKGLYCGDQNAMKAAGHDLRNMIQLFELGLPKICFPLMCTIDWCGFRLVAMSLLPISDQTLIYGSSDGGNTVVNENDEFEQFMKVAAQKLNLVGHQCGLEKESSQFLYTCADCEGHLGNDKRFYIVDTARMSPPEWMDPKHVASSPSLRRWHLFRQLRPELVRNWKTPLNPDAFSLFLGAMTKNLRLKHESEVEACTKHMFNHVIPEFAKKLSVRYADSNIDNIQQLTLDRLVMELHEAGINIRHLGLLRHHLESDANCVALKSHILLEMCCRAIKEELNERMRREMKRITTPSSLPFDKIIISFYNVMFSDIHFWSSTVHSDDKTSNKSTRESSDVPPIKTLIIKKFGREALSEKEINPQQAIYPHDPVCLVTRLQQLLGVRLYPSAIENLQYLFGYGRMKGEQLSVEDIEQRDVRVKHLNFISYAQAISDLIQAQKTDNREKKLRLLENANRHFEASGLRLLYRKDKEHLKEVMNMWGDVLLEYGLLITIDTTSTDLFTGSRNKIKLAKLYFEMAYEKYSRTESGDRILKLADEGSRKLFQLMQQHNEINRQRTSTTSTQSSQQSVAPHSRSLPNTGSGLFNITLSEVLSFLKKIMGDDYLAKVATFPQFRDWSTMCRWASILYRAALQSRELPKESKLLLETAGKLYLNAVKDCPSKFEPLASWLDKVRDEDIGHIVELRKYQTQTLFHSGGHTLNCKTKEEEQNVISKFDSSWVSGLSLETFLTMVKYSSLKVLILRGTQICPEVFSALPSLQDHFQELVLFSVQQSGSVTFDMIERALRKSRHLEQIIIHNCSKIREDDFKKHFRKKNEDNKDIQIIIEMRTVSNSSHGFVPPPGQMSVSLSLIKGKEKITHLLPEDEQILTSLIEGTLALENWFRHCNSTTCPEFRIASKNNDVIVVWDEGAKATSLSPKEYCTKFIQWVWEQIGYKVPPQIGKDPQFDHSKKDKRTKGLNSKQDCNTEHDIDEVLIPDPNKIANWKQLAVKIYRRLLRLYIHVAQHHTVDFDDDLIKFWIMAKDVLELGTKYHLIRLEDYQKHDDVINMIEHHANLKKKERNCQ